MADGSVNPPDNGDGGQSEPKPTTIAFPVTDADLLDQLLADEHERWAKADMSREHVVPNTNLYDLHLQLKTLTGLLVETDVFTEDQVNMRYGNLLLESMITIRMGVMQERRGMLREIIAPGHGKIDLPPGYAR